MIVNSAFLSAMILLLGVFAILDQVTFLAPYRHVIFVEHLWLVVGGLVVVFLNLFAACYLAGRGLFLKDTGRKLAHVERQLRTPDAVVRDLSIVWRRRTEPVSRDTRDDRDEAPRPTADRSLDSDRSSRRVDAPIEGLALPRGDRREAVEQGERVYHLRGSESRILAIVGTFRVVPATDLMDGRSSPDAFKEDVRHLATQGLIERHTIPINRDATPVVVLTRSGKALLDSRRDEAFVGRQQQYHAGLVKPRELSHDAQLYRLYQAEAGRVEDDGGRITRVILDYELKREYQTFLNRPDRREDTDRQDDVATFAATAQLPVIDGHLELPDLRIEYETEDGRVAYRDLELVTEHYSRAQLAGKGRAGFGLYRAAGAGRGRGGSTRTGGTPVDPHHLERL